MVRLLPVWVSLQLLIVIFFLSSTIVVSAFTSNLKGVTVTSVKTNQPIDLGTFLEGGGGGADGERSMIIFGTYAADFNAIEYAQRLRYYYPKLQSECGIKKCAFILNCKPEAAITLMEEVDLITDATNDSTSESSPITLLVDEDGHAGRVFGVERGWLPEKDDISPFVKLFGMLWGLGAWATLPAVIGGYIGNPLYPQPWIEDALAVGQNKGRWPDTALELSEDGKTVLMNKFKELPLVGNWPRRPLELATLRLQNMMGVSLAKWKELAPDEDALNAGVLTQLGGCLVVDSKTGDTLFKWRDPGICAVTNFEDVIKELSITSSK